MVQVWLRAVTLAAGVPWPLAGQAGGGICPPQRQQAAGSMDLLTDSTIRLRSDLSGSPSRRTASMTSALASGGRPANRLCSKAGLD